MSLKIDFSFGIILSILFVVLKTVGVINWSWIWVFSPLWIEAILTIIIVLIVLIIRKLAKKGWYLF